MNGNYNPLFSLPLVQESGIVFAEASTWDVMHQCPFEGCGLLTWPGRQVLFEYVCLSKLIWLLFCYTESWCTNSKHVVAIHYVSCQQKNSESLGLTATNDQIEGGERPTGLSTRACSNDSLLSYDADPAFSSMRSRITCALASGSLSKNGTISSNQPSSSIRSSKTLSQSPFAK